MTRSRRKYDARGPPAARGAWLAPPLVALVAALLVLALASGCGGEPRDERERTVAEEAPELSTVDLAPLRGARPDLQPTGSLGWALLDDEIANAVLEIHSAPGVTLGQATVSALEEHLAEHGSKEVEVVRAEPLPRRDVYEAEALVELAREHRSHSSTEDTVAIHVLVLPGRFERKGAMGVAFLATTFATFIDALAEQVPGGTSRAEYAAAVASHELGHLFGLVNLTGVGGFHEDEDHPGHSVNRESVMHVAVEMSPAGLGGSPPTDFHADDRREMEQIRDQRGR